jgi:KUP system potassium uptake protein
METPNVTRTLGMARRQGVSFDIMTTTFFVSRTSLVAKRGTRLQTLQSNLFIILARNATDAFQFFQIPASRIVELGNQVAI